MTVVGVVIRCFGIADIVITAVPDGYADICCRCC